jgi:hypothetical protein
MSGALPGIPSLDRIEEEWLDPELIEPVPVDWVRRRVLLPIRRDGRVVLAGSPDTPLQAYEDLALLLGVEADWVSAPAPEIQRAIDRCYFRGPARPPRPPPMPPGKTWPRAAKPTICWRAAPTRP